MPHLFRGLRFALAGAAICCIGIPFVPNADAETVYTYTGKPFNDLRNGHTCPPVCRVTGWFAVPEPLAPNLSDVVVTPTTFALSSGGITLTDGIPADSSLAVFTDASGNISNWSWVEVGPPSSPVARILTEDTSFTPGGIVADDVRFGSNPPPLVGPVAGLVENDPGTWSSAQAPEPAAASLFLAGLIIAAGAVRLHFRRT